MMLTCTFVCVSIKVEIYNPSAFVS